MNESKSAVARPHERKFLGYTFWYGRGGEVKRRVAPKALEALKERLRELTGRSRGRSLAAIAAELRTYLRGWKAYFRLADTPGVFAALDKWLRRRLRQIQVKQWKRAHTMFRELKARGVEPRIAARAWFHAGRWWRLSNHPALCLALPELYFDQLGVPRLGAHLNSSNRRIRTRTSGGVGGA